MINIESLSKTAMQLASTQWTWEWGAIQSNLKSLGWTKSASVGERDTYSSPQSVAADVYHGNRKPELIELCFAVFTDVESLDDLEYDDKAAEFYEAFKQGTSAIAKHLGKPVFSNGAAAKGFPSDQDAEWLSLWELPTCRLMFQQKHEDRDLPFRLCIVVAPR